MSQFADISPVSIPKTGKKAGLSFEEIYHPLRTKENRVYTDREIAQLPDISNTHPHYKEWQIRKQSSDRLTAYFEKLGFVTTDYIDIMRNETIVFHSFCHQQVAAAF